MKKGKCYTRIVKNSFADIMRISYILSRTSVDLNSLEIRTYTKKIISEVLSKFLSTTFLRGRKTS
jgi:hypothetical protein